MTDVLKASRFNHAAFFCNPKGTKMALKFLKKKTTKLKSFLREYSISLYLSPCPFIINMFGIAFETDDFYVFAQEYALAGDLFDIIPPQVTPFPTQNPSSTGLVFHITPFYQI